MEPFFGFISDTDIAFLKQQVTASFNQPKVRGRCVFLVSIQMLVVTLLCIYLHRGLQDQYF